MPRLRGVVAGEVREGVLPHLGVAMIKLSGQLAAHLVRFFEQRVGMAPPVGRRDALGPQQKHEPPQVGVVVGQPLGVEPLVGVLVGAFECIVGTACRPSRTRVSRTEVTTIQSQGRLMA